MSRLQNWLANHEYSRMKLCVFGVLLYFSSRSTKLIIFIHCGGVSFYADVVEVNVY